MKNMLSKSVFLVVMSILGGLLLIAAIACGQSAAPTNDGSNHDTATAHISLSEWKISGAHDKELSLPSGRVAIEVHNKGVTQHQLAIWKDGLVEGDAVHDGTLVAKSDVFGPGKMILLETELEEGVEYLLVCPIPGHTAAGMVARVTAVEGAKDEEEENHTHEEEKHHRQN